VIDARVLGGLAVVLAACGGAPSLPRAPDRTGPGAGSCLWTGRSPCLSSTPVSVRRGVHAWADWLARFGAEHGDALELGATECRWISELDGVLLCGSADTESMNRMFSRASLFVEGGFGTSSGTVRTRGRAYRRSVANVGGHDLPRNHPDPERHDLEDYFQELDGACARAHDLCPDAPEQAMRDLLTTAWAGRETFVVITFAADLRMHLADVLSHEVLHAQYFTDARYRTAVLRYWDGLSESPQRQAIRRALSYSYDIGNEEVIRNEFQAYVLMIQNPGNPLARLRSQHRTALLRELAAEGVAPIACETVP
jgi:hypothetical protein